MGLEGGPQCMKIILIVFNFLVLVAGCVAIGIGAWSYTSDFGADDMSSITGSDLYQIICIVIIVGGCIVAAIAFFGCCGALKESKCLLGVYSIMLIVLLIVFVVGGVLAIVFWNDVEDELEKEMTKSLKEKYAVDIDDNSDNRAVTELWDKIQEKLKCCGVSGGMTSNTSWYIWQDSTWFKGQIAFDKDYVPNSCCNIDVYTFDKCIGLNANSTMPVQTSPVGLIHENPALYSDGCLDKVKDEIGDHVVAIGIAAAVVLVVMLFSIIFAISVIRSIDRQGMVV